MIAASIVAVQRQGGRVCSHRRALGWDLKVLGLLAVRVKGEARKLLREGPFDRRRSRFAGNWQWKRPKGVTDPGFRQLERGSSRHEIFLRLAKRTARGLFKVGVCHCGLECKSHNFSSGIVY